MNVILGIDPGSRKTGFGIINFNQGKIQYLSSGCIKLENLDTFGLRLCEIHSAITQLVDEFNPHELAIEQVFMGKNADSALKLGQARGVAIQAGLSKGLEMQEYAPRRIKQTITGQGGADKIQVQHMVTQLLNLPGCPQEDAADALAVAITHAFSKNISTPNQVYSKSKNGRWHYRTGKSQ